MKSLTSVDYQGMLPEGSGNYSGTPNDTVVRQSRIANLDEVAASRVSDIEPLFADPTAKDYTFEMPCYQ